MIDPSKKSIFQKISIKFPKLPQVLLVIILLILPIVSLSLLLAPDTALANPSADPNAGQKLFTSGLALFNRIIEAVAGFATTVLLFLINILINVITYDAFNHPGGVIDQGWPLVRDAMNMFVILALLAIAIKNLIPGQGDIAQTQKQIISLIIAVVLMNFSRTIALLAVDFSQVVTMTFATAIAEVASGNFIQMFSIQSNLVLSDASVAGTADGTITLLAGSLSKLFILALAILAIGMTTVAFIVRIFLLWLLIVLSPLAFFAFGIKDISGKMSSIYSEWMNQFTGMLLFGPVLMFFLWLAMAISSSGDIASTTGFSGDFAEGTQGILESFSVKSYMNAFLAVAIMLLGIQQAAKMSSSIPGIGSIMGKTQSFGNTMARKAGKVALGGTAIVATGGAAVGAAGLLGAAGLAAGGAAGAAGYAKRRQFAGSVGGGAMRTTQKIGSYMAATGIPILAGTGKFMASKSGEMKKKIEQFSDKDRVEGREGIEKMDEVSQMDELANFSKMTNIGQELDHRSKVRGQALQEKLLTDTGFRKKFAGSYSSQYASILNSMINSKQKDKDQFSYITDDKERDALIAAAHKTRTENIHLLDDKGAVKKSAVLKDKDTDYRNFNEESFNDPARGEELAALFADQVVQEKTYVDKDGVTRTRQVTAAERLAERGDQEAFQAFKEAYRRKTGQEWQPGNSRNASVPLQPQGGALSQAQITEAKTLEKQGWDKVKSADLTSKLSSGNLDISQVPLDKLNPREVTAAASDIAAKIASAPNFQQAISSIPESVFTALGDEISDEIINSSNISAADIAKLPATQRQQVIDRTKTQLGSLAAAGGPGEEKARQVIADGGKGDMAFAFTLGGNFVGNGENQFKVLLDSQPSVAMSAPDLAPVQKAVIDQLNDARSKFHAEINSMVNAAKNSSDKAQRKEAEDMVRKLREAHTKSGATTSDARISNYESMLGI